MLMANKAQRRLDAAANRPTRCSARIAAKTATTVLTPSEPSLAPSAADSAEPEQVGMPELHIASDSAPSSGRDSPVVITRNNHKEHNTAAPPDHSTPATSCTVRMSRGSKKNMPELGLVVRTDASGALAVTAITGAQVHQKGCFFVGQRIYTFNDTQLHSPQQLEQLFQAAKVGKVFTLRIESHRPSPSASSQQWADTTEADATRLEVAVAASLEEHIAAEAAQLVADERDLTATNAQL